MKPFPVSSDENMVLILDGNNGNMYYRDGTSEIGTYELEEFENL